MSNVVTVRPERLSQFGSAADCNFYLMTNDSLADAFVIDGAADYRSARVVALKETESFEEALADLPGPAHILVVSPERFFQSPEVLAPDRKLLAMACNSTPTTLAEVRHFLQVMEDTSATEQDAFSERFFDLAEQADRLEYANPVTGTVAHLDHFADGLVWNQQAGSLEWGQQQIVPSGEISVLPVEITDFDERLYLPLDGEITLQGYPILHSGTPSFSRADQARIHAALAAMEQHPIKAAVEGGHIVGLTAVEPGAAPAVAMLESMFEVDSRYRKVWEIGHALNTSLRILPGNHAMNEVYGGTAGCVHWGLGLTPYTQYHLDIIAPQTIVRSAADAEAILLRGEAPAV